MPNGLTAKEESHGTLVGSRILFGDDIENKIQSNILSPACQLVDISVFGKGPNNKSQGPSESELLLILDRVIPSIQSKVKIINMSLGFTSQYNLTRVSKIAQYIDSLSIKYDIIFVKSSGNNPNRSVDYPANLSLPEARLTPPAESLHVISVGSYAKYSDQYCWSGANELSAFSRIGPGYNESIKPEVVEHGGNILKNWNQSPRHSVYGIHEDGASLSYSVGTSFSAPVICNHLCYIAKHFGSYSPNLLKSLLFHFSDEIVNPTCQVSKLFLSGFGKPNLANVLNSKDSNIGFIYSGELAINQYQWVGFHIPSCVSSIDDIDLEVSFTIVFNPPINKDNVKEYSKCRISCQLFKNTSSGLRSIATLNDDETNSKSWNPVIKYKKNFRRNYSSGEWRVRLRLFARKLDDAFKQSFTIVIEVKDKNGSKKLYGSFLKEFGGIYLPTVKRKAA